MASINKSFNFRHGVQVDDKDFTVRGSLVGIGTTVPTEKLDVRGNAVVSGFTSSVYLNVSGVSTFVGHVNSSTVGASGSITALKFYGDGSNLTQLPTSQWVDVDVGLGYTSIYNNGGNVGVGTTDPRHSMQVGGDPTFGSTGVGIHSAGNVHATGVITATTFVGEIDSASLDTNPSGITVTGVATAASFSGNFVGNITGNVTGNVNANTLDSSKLSVTGITTFNDDVRFKGANAGVTSAFWDKSANSLKFKDESKTVFGDGGDLEISHTNSLKDQVDSNGDSICDGRTTYIKENGAGGLVFKTDGSDGPGAYQFFDQGWKPILKLHSGAQSRVILYHIGTQRLITTNKGIEITSQLDVANVNVSGVVTATSFTGNITGAVTGNVTGNLTGDVTANGIGVTSLNVSGVSTLTGNVNVSGNIDVDGLTELDDVQVAGASSITGAVTVGGNIRGDGKLGIGTEAQTDLQIQNAAESAIVLGRSHAITGTNASIRFGTSNAAFPYSVHTPESLDFINYGKGNVNFYLEAGVTGLGTGGFYWHRRSNFDQLMTLTYGGKLGLGVTVPNNDLHVVGTSTVTDNAWFGVNVNVASDINVGQNIIATGSVTASGLTVPFVEAELRGNVYKTTGISTFNDLKADGMIDFGQSVGIGTTAVTDYALNVYDKQSLVKSLFVNPPPHGGSINEIDPTEGGDGLGIGVSTLNDSGAVNFASAGVATTRYMIVPKVTTSQQGGLVNLTDGSIIYNTETNKFRGRANGAWVDLH